MDHQDKDLERLYSLIEKIEVAMLGNRVVKAIDAIVELPTEEEIRRRTMRHRRPRRHPRLAANGHAETGPHR